MLKPLATLLAVALPTFAYATEQGSSVLSIHPSPPAVSFDVHVANSEGVVPVLLPLPRTAQTNADGLSVVLIEGVERTHIAGVADQAAGGPSNDISMKPPGQNLSPAQLTALKWLAANTINLRDSAVTWHYTFDYQFNNQFIKSGWASAFAQADVIKALLLAHQVTKDVSYLELAKQAAYAYAIPCEQGGLRCDVGGVPWFEELPMGFGYAPMILNGHLYSVVMLHHLWQATGDARVKAAFDEGLESSRKLLLRFDNGYWSTYQLRPRTVNLMFAVAPGDAATELQEISVASQFSPSSSVPLTPQGQKTFPTSVVWGELGDTTQTGRVLKGLSFAQILPGRLSVDHDPVNFSGFNVSVRYSAPECRPPKIAGLDWRMGGRGWIQINDVRVESDAGRCTASARLDANNNQWSQISTVYHDWHTRLVTELWRVSQEPLFYATALRWRRYAEIYKQQEASLGESRMRPAPAMPTNDSQAAEAVMQALEGADPTSITSEEVLRRVQAWIAEQATSPAQAQSMLTLIGERSISAPAD